MYWEERIMKKILIFGAGERLEMLEKEGYLNNYEILAICDNDIKKQGNYFNKYEIIKPSRIHEFAYEEIWISTNQYYNMIKNQLTEELGINEDVISVCLLGA